ncbi:uncharacterized protein LOC126156822 [Schistocerca cancellata]|uniref:uncharacterized protein LOC126156822 n=1 Tax=Schistocerca cancellata TaxID=274614 RepID=UPI002117CDFC|nr:uncharacterized protein LOC126156822 [Schistocerca cancellata]
MPARASAAANSVRRRANVTLLAQDARHLYARLARGEWQCDHGVRDLLQTAAAGPRTVGGRDGRAAGQLGGAAQAVGATAQEARRPPPEGPRRAHLTHRPGGQVASATMRRPFDAGLGGRQVPGARHGRRRPREPAARRGRLPEEGGSCSRT